MSSNKESGAQPTIISYQLKREMLLNADHVEALAMDIAKEIADVVDFNLGGVWLVLPAEPRDVKQMAQNGFGENMEFSNQFISDETIPKASKSVQSMMKTLSNGGSGVSVTTPYGSFAIFTLGTDDGGSPGDGLGGFIYGDATHLSANSLIFSLVISELATILTERETNKAADVLGAIMDKPNKTSKGVN